MNFVKIAEECSSSSAVKLIGEDFIVRFADKVIDEIAEQFKEPYETYENKWIVDMIHSMKV